MQEARQEKGRGMYVKDGKASVLEWRRRMYDLEIPRWGSCYQIIDLWRQW